MFRKSLSLLLILLTLSTGFTRLFMRAGYELNKDYIAKVLCENKAKPKMQCNGKCYLAKKIKQAEEGEQKQHQSPSKRFSVEVFLVSQQGFKCYTQLVDEFLPVNKPSYTYQQATGFFHPPQYS